MVIHKMTGVFTNVATYCGWYNQGVGVKLILRALCETYVSNSKSKSTYGCTSSHHDVEGNITLYGNFK